MVCMKKWNSMIFYCNIDILSLSLHPIIAFFSLLDINTIRLIIKEVVKLWIYPMMPIGGGNPPQGGRGNQGGAQAPQGAQNNTGGYIKTPGPNGNTFIVADPGDIGSQGYINPVTGRPHNHSFQPFARNLRNAMVAHVQSNGQLFSSWDDRDFYPVSNRFYREYMEYNYPRRIRNNYYNSHPVRTGIFNLP